MGVGCGEGVSPSPPGVESGEGALPPPQKIFGLLLLKLCILTRSETLSANKHKLNFH